MRTCHVRASPVRPSGSLRAGSVNGVSIAWPGSRMSSGGGSGSGGGGTGVVSSGSGSAASGAVLLPEQATQSSSTAATR